MALWYCFFTRFFTTNLHTQYNEIAQVKRREDRFIVVRALSMVKSLGFPFSSKILFSEITKQGKTDGTSLPRVPRNRKHVKFCFIKFREIEGKPKICDVSFCATKSMRNFSSYGFIKHCRDERLKR